MTKNGTGALSKKTGARRAAKPAEPQITEVRPARPMSSEAPVAPTIPAAPEPEPASNAPRGIRLKMIQGLADVMTLHLEPATFPDKAHWCKSPQGLIAGIAVEGPDEAVISYNPVVVPRVNGGKKLTIFVSLASDKPGPEAGLEVRVLHANGTMMTLSMKGLARCVERPEIGFPISLDQVNRTLCIAVVVRPRGSYGVIVHSVWAEIEA